MDAFNRTAKINKNILYSFGLKGLSILISFLLVPLTLGYLNTVDYGIWLTLSSLLTWINYFDIGLGNGLRNKLTEALALENTELAQRYVSTTVAILSVIALFFFICFAVFAPWLDWSTILNVNPSTIADLKSILIPVFAFFCLQFIFKTVGIILVSDQRPAANDALNVFASLLSFASIYILSKFTNGSLVAVTMVFAAAPVLVYIIASALLFKGKYKHIRPELSKVNFTYFKSLASLGVQFFIIQIAVLIIYTTGNLIISHYTGPEQVTPFNIAFRYFSVVTMVFNIILTPFWSAITEAYIKKENIWIKNSINKIIKLWFAIFIITIVMAIFSKFVYKIWVGRDIQISGLLTWLCALYVSVVNFGNIFGYFVNGTGNIRLQLLIAIITSLVFIPLAIFMCKSIGPEGVIAAMTIVLAIPSFILPVQYLKIINGKAGRGIWSK